MDALLQNPNLIYAIGAFLLIVLGWFVFFPAGAMGGLDKRMKRVQGRVVKKTIDTKASVVDIRVNTNGSGLERLFKRILPNPDLLKQKLERTGKNISLTHYALMIISLGILVGMIAHFRFNVSNVAALLIGVVGGFKLASFIINFMIARRMKKFIKSFPDAIDLMVRGIKSGLPISQTVQSISQEIDAPVGEEFEKVSDAMRIGIDLHDALWSRAKKMDIPEFKFFCIALSIQKETGGNLSETLGNLAVILRKRKQMKLKIKAMSSEAKASAIIIGSLPFIMYGILNLLNPEYVDPLLNDPRGIKMAFVGLGMIGLGVLVMNKMVSFEI